MRAFLQFNQGSSTQATENVNFLIDFYSLYAKKGIYIHTH